MLEAKSNRPASAAQSAAAKPAATSIAPEPARDAAEPRTDTTSIRGAYTVVGVFFFGLILLVLVEALRR